MDNNLSLIFFENPIARGYLNILLKKKLFDSSIIYFSKYSNFKLYRKYLFKRNNHYPLVFLKDIKIVKLIEQFEEFFSFRNNFVIDMYKYDNIENFPNIKYFNCESINSKSFIENIVKDESKHYLISYQQILKEVFISNKNFYHIHPGYLPLIKGADGSLHSILKFNSVGCSFFKMNERIDEGEIINRVKFKFNKFRFDYENFYDWKTLYRIWFSFFDPLLRCYMLDLFLDNRFSLKNSIKNNKNEKSQYYTFMNSKELELSFKKIFK